MKKLVFVLMMPVLALGIYDMKWFDLNHWLCPFYNDGRWGIDITQGTGVAAGSWPQPLHNCYVFGAGPWVGSTVGSDTLVTFGYNPNSGGTEFGPTLSRYWRQGTGDSADRIYKYPGDWPPPQSRFPMAPQQPRSESDMWCCFGDSAPWNHAAQWSAFDVALAGNHAYLACQGAGLVVIDVSNPQSPYEAGYCDTPGTANGVAVVGSYAYVADGSSGLRIINVSDPQSPYEVGNCNTQGRPLGIDIYLTVYGFSDSLGGDIYVLRYELANHSGSALNRTYFGIALDGDVGDATDDMTGLMLDKFFQVGSDTFRVKNVGYIYDYDNNENPGRDWDSGTPGAVALRLLHAPGNLGLTAFKKFTIDIDPVADPDQYLTLAGYNYRTGAYEPYDSVDVAPADKRALLATGPFNLLPDEVATFYYAVVAAPYGTSGQPPSQRDTTELALRCWWAERAFQRIIGIAEQKPEPAVPHLTAGPNPFSRGRPLRISTPVDGPLAVDIYDATGRLVRAISSSRSPTPTPRALLWPGTDSRGRLLPAGIYFVQATTPTWRATVKVLQVRD